MMNSLADLEMDSVIDTVEMSSSCGNDSTIEKDVIRYAMSGTELASMLLCVTAILLVFAFKLHKKFAYRMAMYQVLSSMFVNCSLAIATLQFSLCSSGFTGLLPGEIVCKIGAVSLEYFMWVKLLISSFLLFHIFCLAILLKNFLKLEKVYVALSLILPLLIAWIPFTTSSYGQDGRLWCWITEEQNSTAHLTEGMVEQYALWYGPLAVCTLIGLLAIFTILIGFKYRYNNLSISEETNPLLEGYMKRYMLMVYFRKLIPLLIYPFLFFALCAVPIVWQVMHNVSLSKKPKFGLSLAYSLCYSSVGLFSGIVLIFHVLLVRRLRSWNEYFLDSKIKTSSPTRSGSRSTSHSYDDETFGAVVIDNKKFRSANFREGGISESFRSSSRSSNYTASVGL